MPAAAIAPLVVLVIAYYVWLLRDISQSEVQHLPKWAWAVIVLLSVPVGGIVYLMIGKRQA